MEIYSPKSNHPDKFRKNTLSHSVQVSKKAVFEIETREKRKEEKAVVKPKQKNRLSLMERLKLKFYERMRVFFDFEDRYEEEKKEHEWNL
jgi:hypothetical protein